jgi:hypothetical protein
MNIYGWLAIALVLSLLAAFLWAVFAVSRRAEDQAEATEAAMAGMIGGAPLPLNNLPLQACNISPDGYCDFPGDRDDDGDPCIYCHDVYRLALPCG